MTQGNPGPPAAQYGNSGPLRLQIRQPRPVGDEPGQRPCPSIARTVRVEVKDERGPCRRSQGQGADHTQQAAVRSYHTKSRHIPRSFSTMRGSTRNVCGAEIRYKGFDRKTDTPASPIPSPLLWTGSVPLRRDPYLPASRTIVAMRQAAFFDLDKTVIAKSSTLAFGKPFYKAGFVGRRALMKMGFAQLFYVLFGADKDQLERARDNMLRLTTGWHRAEIEQLVEETIEEVADPLVYAEALTLIDQHKREGRKVVIVSASPEQIVRPLGRYIGVTDFIATKVKTDAAGFFLPELELYAMGEGKVDAIRQLADREDLDLENSYAYSDSVTDLPMMEMVGNPVAVNPDKELRAIAEERVWPILDFERQVSLRTRLPRPNPWWSGATVAAVAAAVAAGILLRKKGL